MRGLRRPGRPPACPASAQAGISTLGFPGPSAVEDFQTLPVFNIEARDTVTAEFLIASVAGYFNVPITARGRTNGDYGVDTLALLIPNFIPLGGQAFTFWGVPWAAEHDPFRIDGVDASEDRTAHKIGFPASKRRPYQPSWGPIKPFFTNPTACTGAQLPVSFDMDSWGDPVFLGGSYVTSTVLADPLGGCDALEFDPAITLHPTVSVADSPAGIDVLC